MSFHKRVLRALGNGPAKRNLFGPVDRQQLQQDYRVALRHDLEEASRRWGFNFITEKPMEDGDFLWEGISGAKVPLVYRSSMFQREPGAADSGAMADSGVATVTGASPSSLLAGAVASMSQSGKENVPRTPERHANNLPLIEKTPVKRNASSDTLKRKQTNITDFYQAKKRIVASSRKSGE